MVDKETRRQSLQVERERQQYLKEKSRDLNDIKPDKRLEFLYAETNYYYVDSKIPIIQYCRMSNHLLTVAKNYEKNKNFELALSTYLKYKSLIKNMRLNSNSQGIPTGVNASFDYKLKYVNQNISKLRDLVLEFYRRNYFLTRQSIKADRETTYLSDRIDRKGTIMTENTCFSNDVITTDQDIAKYATKKFSIRKVFPKHQIRAFEKLHTQRKIVKHFRTITVPCRVNVAFSYLSKQNSLNNMVTMGYLAGKEEKFGLVVTHLIIPKQEAMCGSFKIVDHRKVLSLMESEELITLGWIHTHPVDSPFLSSADMHYQSVFQSILPEAIAMVFSPKDMAAQIFNLHPKTGLVHLLKCKKSGFHTHPNTDPPLVMVSQHAMMDLKGPLVVKDYREEDDGSCHEDTVQSKIYSQIYHLSRDHEMFSFFNSLTETPRKKLPLFGYKQSIGVTFWT